MATQQGAPSRPWFRLATMVRPPPSSPPNPQPDQAPPPPPQAPPPAGPGPRPAFVRPAFSQPIRPGPAPPQPTAAANGVTPTPPPTPPQPLGRDTSNEPRPMRSQQSGPPLTTTSPINTNRPATPTSPKINRVSRTPSPLALPSPQLKSYNGNQPQYEQKTVLVQETKEKPTIHNPKPDPPKKPETSKNHSDSEDFRMRIITIAGENKGAIMDLTPFGKRTHNFGNNTHKLYTKDENPTPTSSDGEKSGGNSDGHSKAKKKNQKSKSRFMNAIMNSNVQGVNNSILFNSSATHHDPGIHLSRPRKPNGGHRF